MAIGLEPVRRSSLPEAVFDQLCGQILAGRVSAGQPLPPERELATALGVNRGAVREGLKRLSQAGLVEQRHGGGTFVLDYRRTADLGLLARLLFDADGQVDLHVGRSIIEMRAALAPDIARLCAERSSIDLHAQLLEIVSRMRGAKGKLERLQLLSLELWELLVQGCDNIAYRLAFNTLRHTYEQIREALIIPLARELRAVDRLAELVDAVVAGDPATAHRVAAEVVSLGSAGMQAALALLDPDPADQTDSNDSNDKEPTS